MVTNGLLKDGGSGRRNAVEKLVKSARGKLDGVSFVLGDSDILVWRPARQCKRGRRQPDPARERRGTSTTVALLTAEEMDAATKKSVAYRNSRA